VFQDSVTKEIYLPVALVGQSRLRVLAEKLRPCQECVVENHIKYYKITVNAAIVFAETLTTFIMGIALEKVNRFGIHFSVWFLAVVCR
jgi:hypothetical protein